MRKISLLLLLSVISFLSKSQENDPVLLTVNNKNVLLSEFNAIFKKNNNKETEVTPEAVREYLELYIKFKLKVTEAEEMGYDTTDAFVKELEGYRKQLIQPYLSDREVTEGLIKEAYDRMQFDVNASHILFAVGPDALPKDTLNAYKDAMKAKMRIMKGESFEKVAEEMSTDPSAKSNKGNLGYFSALHMVYPFETATYNLKVGEISDPVRTRFGYHIIKLNDKRKARGTIRVAHIMQQCSKDEKSEIKTNESEKEKKINEIYEMLKEDPSQFKSLAKQFSDDKNSATRGGELAAFSTGKMVPEFEEAAFALTVDGEISKPIRTDYGFHIIQRLELKEIDTYENMYNTLKSKVSRDSRANKSKDVVIDRIKKENKFVENINERNDFYKVISEDDLAKGEWSATKAKGLNKLMFGFYAADGDKSEFTQEDFAAYLENHKPKANPNNPPKVMEVVNKIYAQLIEEKALKFKEDRLGKTNLEYKLLYQEYRDGILLFELTDEKVWSKAIKDSTGLQSFYDNNKNNYMWADRADATIYKCSDEKVAASLEKILKKKAKKGYSNDDILKMINVDSQLSLSIEEGKFEKGQNEIIDKVEWVANTTTKLAEDKNVNVVVINNLLKPEPKKLNEVRGIVTSDYQNYLEKQWVDDLKSKYKVSVNDEVLKLVK